MTSDATESSRMPASASVFSDPLALRHPGLDEALAVAGEVAQDPDRRRRDEAAPQQAVLEELGEPGGVAHVGLAPGQDPDVPGVDEQELEAALLEGVPDRLPVLPGRLHHDVGHALRGEPARERREAAGERAERAGLGLAPGTVGHADAGDHLVLPDVEPGTPLVEDFHAAPPLPCVAPGRAVRCRRC
jgi:hypothetical protein